MRIYGRARYEQLTRLANAMAHVRGAYGAALEQARQRGEGPGWSVREVAAQHVAQHDGESYWTASSERSFDVDAFTAWYIAQPGLANEAFRDFYGASTTTSVSSCTNANGDSSTTTTRFANPRGRSTAAARSRARAWSRSTPTCRRS